MEGKDNFKIDKLVDSNFHVWKQKVELVFGDRGVTDHILDTSTPDDPLELAQWKKDDAKAKAVIGLTLSNDLLEHVRGLETAFEMWEVLVGAGYGMGYDVSGHCPQLQFDGIRHSDWTVQWYVQCSGTHSTVVCTVQWCVQCSGMYSTVVRTVKWYAQYRSRTVNCHDRMDLQLMVQQTGTATWRSDPCDPS